MTKTGSHAGRSTALMVVTVIGILFFVGGAIGFFAGGNALVLPAIAFGLFLVLQFFIFRALGLRSRADEEPDDARAQPEDDWRAWRG